MKNRMANFIIHFRSHYIYSVQRTANASYSFQLILNISYSKKILSAIKL